MRFPFMFMAILSLVVAAWSIAYLLTARLYDPFARGFAITACLIFAGLGCYQVFVRVRRGPQS